MENLIDKNYLNLIGQGKANMGGFTLDIECLEFMKFTQINDIEIIGKFNNN